MNNKMMISIGNDNKMIKYRFSYKLAVGRWYRQKLSPEALWCHSFGRSSWQSPTFTQQQMTANEKMKRTVARCSDGLKGTR